MTSKATTPQALYQRAAQDAAHTVIRQYSTSFGVATAMLTEPVRTHVRNIYALVRVADEIVDGSFDPAPIPHLTAALDALEAEVAQAMDRGFSTNLIVHAFAHTAVTCGITDAEIAPFFASMRRDLGDPYYTAEELSTYIYGSAEVIGMMCLRAFAQAPDVAPTQRSTLVADNIDAARALGAAFQKINFLRDLAADQGELGRYYFHDVAAKVSQNRSRTRSSPTLSTTLTLPDKALHAFPVPRVARSRQPIYSSPPSLGNCGAPHVTSCAPAVFASPLPIKPWCWPGQRSPPHPAPASSILLGGLIRRH